MNELLPREKAISNGIESLSDIELLALILKSAYKDKNVFELSKEIIAEIMLEEKANQKKKIVLTQEKTFSLIPDEIPVYKQEEYVARALEYYRKHGR